MRMRLREFRPLTTEEADAFIKWLNSLPVNPEVEKLNAFKDSIYNPDDALAHINQVEKMTADLATARAVIRSLLEYQHFQAELAPVVLLAVTPETLERALAFLKADQ